MRIFLFVINGLGVGSLPDIYKYEKEYHCTLDEIECNDLSTFVKLGINKSALKDLDKNTIGYCFRGRGLTDNTSFESGLNEILGNITFNDSAQTQENLVDILKKKNVNVIFASSRQDSIADIIYLDDKLVIENCCDTASKDNSVIILELNDFAKYCLNGDKQNMQGAIKYIDNFLDNFISNIEYRDILFITGNFGINPTKIGITREYNPIFIYNKLVRGNSNLKTIQGNNSIAMTIVDLLNIYPNSHSIVDDSLKQKISVDNLFVKRDRIMSGIGKIKELNSKSVPKQKNKNNSDKNKIIKVKIVKK